MENSSSDSDSEADYESLAGTSPHKDPGQLGSGQPTATVPKEGYLANQNNTGEVPTKIDQATQTSIRCFSPRLCIDLVGQLTEQQLKAEISRVYPRDYVDIRNTPRKQRFSLRQYYASVLMTDGETLTNQLDDLTAHFSRHVGDANIQLENLKRSIDSAQKMIDGLQAPTVTLPDRAVDQTTPSPDTVSSPPTPGNLDCPYKLFEGNPFSEFDAHELDSSTEYDRDFGNRKTAYYGTLPYKYGGSHHKARDINTNPYLKSVIDKLHKLSPDLPNSSNSFLVTKYDSHDSCIPPHSDNEPSIDPDSSILTITLGGSRPVVFRRKPPGKNEQVTITPEHGSLYIMTRSSQNHFDHSVPRVKQDQHPGMRISITCRTLTSPPLRPAHNVSASPANSVYSNNEHAGPKRVLILSDSKNASFDCSDFPETVAAFREDLFLLRDLYQHEQSIRQVDVVLISAGINDLMKNGATPLSLHNHLLYYVKKFRDSNVQFIFDSISPLSIYADRFNKMNRLIDHTNELLLQLSLRHRNFKLFDNIQFGLPHLARDGLHLNKSGKAVLSRCWIHCILLVLGLKRGPLPLRVRYVNIVERFSFPK